MPDQNVYERRAARLIEHFETVPKRLAQRLMGGARPPFTVRLSQAEELARLGLMPDEAWNSLLAGMGPEAREAFLKHVGMLTRRKGGTNNGHAA